MYKEVLIDLFKEVFNCKRFLATAGPQERVKQLRTQCRKVCSKDDDVNSLRDNLDELELPFKEASKAEKAQRRRREVEAKVISRNSPLQNSQLDAAGEVNNGLLGIEAD